jgi:hypothetical protein
MGLAVHGGKWSHVPDAVPYRSSNLSPEKVKKILADPRTQIEIAKDYEVSQGTVSRIKRGVFRTSEAG